MAYPSVRVKLCDLSTEEMLARVRAGSLQMAFVVQAVRALLRGLHFEEVMREGMSPQHPVSLAECFALLALRRFKVL